MKAGQILVVSDAADLTERIADLLNPQGFRLATAHSAAGARAKLATERVDLALVDLSLKRAAEIARVVHEANVACIVLIARPGAKFDGARLLEETGAEDYVQLPNGMNELVTRIDILLRRRKTPAKPRGRHARFGTFFLDPEARRLTGAGNREIALTGSEFAILVALAQSPQQVLPRDELMRALKDQPWRPDDRSIDVHIGHLRKKIEENPRQPALIKTVHRRGYIFTPQVYWD